MFFIFIGTMMVIWADDEGVPFALFLIDTETISGTVTEYDGRGYDHMLSYSFTDHHGNEYSKSEMIDASLHFTAKVGDTIEVTIFPLYPTVFEATPLIPTMEPAFWIMVVGAAFVLLAAIISVFSMLQMIKHNKEDRYY